MSGGILADDFRARYPGFFDEASKLIPDFVKYAYDPDEVSKSLSQADGKPHFYIVTYLEELSVGSLREVESDVTIPTAVDEVEKHFKNFTV